MKKLASLLAVTLLTVLFFSCTPDTPEEQSGSVGSEPTDTSQISKNVLGKVVRISGTNETTFSYQYDAQNRLVWYSNTSTKADYFEDTSKIIRDNDGIIKQVVYRSDSSQKYPDPKIDSVVFDVSYNSNTSQYTHKVLKYKSYNFNFKDSSVYTYDANKRIIREDVYYFDYLKAKTYLPFAKRDFIYDASGNVTSLKTIYYQVDGVNDYEYNIAYTYEDKGVNLLNLGNEAIVLGMEQEFSPRATKTMVSTYPQSPEYNRSLTYKYSFNTKYRPLTADVSDAVTGAKSSLVYTYQ